MADFNPDDIHRFIDHYRDSADGYSEDPYHDHANQPRSAPPLTGRELLDDDEYSQYADSQYGYGDDDAYTTAPTVTSRAHTSRSSAAPPSIFSARSSAGYSTTRSSAPSHNGPNHHHIPFAQQFAHPTHPSHPTRPDQLLWCEFAPLTACRATFSLADEEGWIAHHITHHLRDTYPTRLMCWFCDQPFDVHAGEADGYANFVERMQHVREHIFGDHRLTERNMRRDLYVVQHVWGVGGLDEGGYRRAMAYDETPAAFRLPGLREGEGRRRHHQFDAPSSRERAQYYDLEKERRAERRRLKEREGRRG